MGERRYLRIGIDLERFEFLDAGAAEAGVNAHQFATVLLGERIDEMVAARVSLRVMPALERLADAVAGPLGLSAQGSTELPRPRRPGHSSRAKPRTQRSASSISSSRGLHDEIVRVLKGRGHPMTAEAIAEAIRTAGRYKAPRSQRPITAQTVNSRVSHPGYRTLFERASGKVALPDRGEALASRRGGRARQVDEGR